MQLQKGQIVEFDVHALAFGGAGIGKYEGMSVFVEGTMPGDRVQAAFTRIKAKFAEADLVKIVKASVDRQEPRCKHFGKCGGCQLQFMPYEKQIEFKKQHVIDSFERIGKIYNPPVQDVIGCEESFYYRNKMEFSFGYDMNMKFALGMHIPNRRFDIIDLDVCYLQSELSVEIVNSVRDFAWSKKWVPFKYSNGRGFLKNLIIREGRSTGEVMVILRTSDQIPEGFEKDAKELVDILLGINAGEKKIVSICWSQKIAKRGQKTKLMDKLLHGKAALHEKMTLKNGDELSFDIFPQAFFQVNTLQAEVLYSQVLELALNKPHKVVFDLFCGTGTIGLFLARHIEQLVGIELNEDAVRSARDNAKKNNIFNADFYCGDVAKILGDIKEMPSLIVVDPPRAGLTEKMIEQINFFGAEQIVYVSCNPSTLARDCSLLGEVGFSVKTIQPVDMFPHTFHIENVCLLER